MRFNVYAALLIGAAMLDNSVRSIKIEEEAKVLEAEPITLDKLGGDCH